MPQFREPPAASFDRIANFRDLGGHTTRDGARVRSGMLYRSGHLAHATDADIERLVGLGVRRVFDFRTKADIKAEGADRLPDATDHLRLPMPDPAITEDLRTIITEAPAEKMESVFGDGKAEAMMIHSAAVLVRERREPYRIFLTELARPESFPALFHCSAGKDRAGWAATLVLLTLGVEEEEIIEEYLLSNRNVESIRKRLSAPGNSAWGELMRPFLEVRREYIEASFAAMHADWGTFDRYLHEGLEITPKQKAQLCQALVQ